MEDFIRDAVLEITGKIIENDVSLLDSGLDSLASVSLRNRIATHYKVNLAPSFLFDYPDIKSITRYLRTLKSQEPNSVKPTLLKKSVSKMPVLVIGAGIGGLAFARNLEKSGVSVIVMEATDRVGGVWHWLANQESKLQIDSPGYGFDSTIPTTSNDLKWETIFPSRKEIIDGTKLVADSLKGPIYFNTLVKNIKKLEDSKYEVTYEIDGEIHKMMVSGVVALTGGLHKLVKKEFPGESSFNGHIALGVADDTPTKLFKDASVVILGHGAFAVENMRTALENGAKHVTIVCRKQNLVMPKVGNWILNSSKGTMSAEDVVDVMRPFYQACGINIEDLETVIRDQEGEIMLNQGTVPAGSDLYFLAQMLGKLKIVIGNPSGFTSNSVILEDGQSIQCDVFLKCLGAKTDDSILRNIFGENTQVDGLWINGDPNLITYNDGTNGSQILNKVKSLLCSSYSFFVQSFVPAYIHFREHPNEFNAVLERIKKESLGMTTLERLYTELWDFIDHAKQNLAKRITEECPFDRFQIECEEEWKSYCNKLGGTLSEGESIWKLLQPALQIIHRRDPHNLSEVRRQTSLLREGSISVFVPRRYRVLFLPGQGTDARLARTLLDQTGWLKKSNLDFVVPDAPYEMDAFTNEEQLQKLGLDGLVKSGLYNKNTRYREWRAGFEDLFQQHHYGTPIQVNSDVRDQWNTTLLYLKEVVQRYGPFDGIAGFCEGASVASVALFLQAQGHDHGLASVKFFLAMAPWRSPMHEADGLFNLNQPLKLPMLQIIGENDMEVFLEAAPHFRKDFVEASEFRHHGQHVYPQFTSNLEKELNRLLKRSEESKTLIFQ
ncbi:hypothetical protein JCM9152_4510 [Halalkalibacter hemicellulosilyticusJCM 9152]|uniref:Carrier domain-containing protein n=2 Tax=Halalkalibacter TaxID=2893056 RepID=W4QLD8_9BACI|nr:hypothetical protein JCM9152_4510 [Halalkalibacter hemicellulosilyticusJCM 9152]